MKNRSTVTCVFFLVALSTCIGCHHSQPQERRLSIRLKAITHADEVQEFTEVPRVALLPEAVRRQLGNMADPDGPMNPGDIYDPSLPSRKLQSAAISPHYCIVSYIEGGYVMRFPMEVFDLSHGGAKLVFIGPGGHKDLKESKKQWNGIS